MAPGGQEDPEIAARWRYLSLTLRRLVDAWLESEAQADGVANSQDSER